jgi:DNA-binding MarR family transcriptional regulator
MSTIIQTSGAPVADTSKLKMDDEAPNLSRFHYFETSEMHPIVEQALAEKGDRAREGWVALFRNRALQLIRKGSSLELAAEAALLNRHLYSPTGRTLQQEAAVFHARLATIADMLTQAGQRSDPAFLSAVLSSHQKYAQSILEALAGAGDDGLPRRDLLSLLQVEESHLSHILGALEKADVIVRLRRPGLKEVRVVLGHMGRNLVNEKILPRWYMKMEQFIVDAAQGGAPEAGTVAEELEEAKVPSRLMATRINTLVTVVADAKVTVATRP